MRYFFLFIFLLFIFSCKHKENVENVQASQTFSSNFKDQISNADADESIDIILIGDWGKSSTALPLISEQMGFVANYLAVDFICTLGDNFYESGVSSVDDPVWNVYHDNFNQASLQIPWYVSLGNHDHYGNVQAQVDFTELDSRWYLPTQFYAEHFPIPGGSDSLGLLAIDSHILKDDPQEMGQIDFIDDFLENDQSKWKIIIGHHPLYSYGHHGENASLKGTLENRLYENEIDMYVSGHDHDMQHIKTNGYTHFFISGSAAKLRPTNTGEHSLYSNSEYGFMLIRLSNSVLKSYFIDINGDVVYSYQIEK